MVKNCIRDDVGFCIVLVRNDTKDKYIDDIYNHGCYVKITDWNQLEDGLLGITVEGQSKVHILNSKLNDDNLLCGNIELSSDEKEYMIPQKYLVLSKFYKKISYTEVLSNDLKVMDSTAISLAKESKIPVLITNINKENSVLNAINGIGKFSKIS